jgi:hypothetical protein
MSKLFTRIASVLIPSVALAGCGPGDFALPPPPADIAPLSATYDNPPGTVDPHHAEQVLADAQARQTALRLDWLPSLLSELLARVRDRLAAGGLPTDPATKPKSDRPILKALVQLHRICVGWADPPGPPAPAQNGTFDLTAEVDQGRLLPTIFGTATNCMAHVQVTGAAAVNAQIDGSVALLLYQPLPTTLAQAGFLFRLMGGSLRGQNDAVSASGDLDFRVINGQIEFRLPQSTGDVIVGIGGGSGTLTLRGANGTFVCNVAHAVCTPSSSSGSADAGVVDGSVVSGAGDAGRP